MIMEMFWIILGVVVALILIYLLLANGDLIVSESVVIDAPVDKVFSYILNLRNWKEWNSWIRYEQNAPLKYSDDVSIEGGYYSWDGKVIGSGKLTHHKIVTNERIEQKIQFFKPFKSSSDISWVFEEENGKIKVTWGMNGKLPFFLKPMLGKMKESLSRDYKMGLLYLAQMLDAKAPKMQLDFVGEIQFDGGTALCKADKGSIAYIQKTMGKGFENLLRYCKDNEIVLTGYPLSVYHKMNPKRGFVYDIAVPVDPSSPPSDEFTLKALPVGKYLKVTLHGSYQYMDLAWYSAFCYLKMHKFKYDWGRASIEVYETSPSEVAPAELITSILVAIK